MTRRLALVAFVLIVIVLGAEVIASRPPRARKGSWNGDEGHGVVDLRADRIHAVLAHGGRVYGIEDHFVYVSDDTGHTYRKLGRLPKPGPLSASARLRESIARSGIVRRWRRYHGPKGMVALRSGTLLVFYDQIYRSTDGGRTFRVVPGTSAEDLPTGFPSSVGYSVGGGDTVYYGEYTTAPRPHVARVIRGVDDGRRWGVAYTFPSGDVFHVHSVTFDSARSRFWIASGDLDAEARLMYTDDHFVSVKVAGCCSQEWRLVDMVVTPEALYWGSDDDRHSPGIYRYDVRTGALERQSNLDNPSYHAALLSNGTMVLSTTYEPQSLYTRSAQPPAATSLWASRDGRRWNKILARSADAEQASRGFRAQLQIPHGDPLPAIFATPWHTERDEFATLRIRAAAFP